MEPRVSLVTLGVSDLKRAVAFYRDGLGWPKSEVGGDEVAFFKTGGAIIALFPREALAADAGVEVAEESGLARFSLAHNVAEEESVDSVLAQAAEAGATIVKEAQEIFFGRHGYFVDPDGFLWEVAWNPSFPMAADGSIEVPDQVTRRGGLGAEKTPCRKPGQQDRSVSVLVEATPALDAEPPLIDVLVQQLTGALQDTVARGGIVLLDGLASKLNALSYIA